MTQKYESLSFCPLFDDVDALLDSLSVRFRVKLYRGTTALSGVGTDRIVALSLAGVLAPLPVTKPFTKLFILFMMYRSPCNCTSKKNKNKYTKQLKYFNL